MPRKRAVNVCSACHQRKIRCDVDIVEGPCTKCAELGEKCMLRTRKPYSKRRPRPRRSTSRDEHKESEDASISESIPLSEATVVVTDTIEQPSLRITPIFIGDGGYSNIFGPLDDPEHLHFFVPADAEKSLSLEDLNYLKLKGCFSLPSESEELLTAYFHFVHPILPILDGSDLLQTYAAGGINSINLLLVWSIFSAAASYVPKFANRAAKESLVQRAKLLFDLTNEKDKIVLVQSALLLSFWFADAEDVKQTWYWTGIAFGIAQTLGLYRDLKDSSDPNFARRRSLWRNIWRSCLLRDTWLTFSMGRPFRLNKLDSNIPVIPSSGYPFTDVVLGHKKLYTESEASDLLSTWKGFVEITDALRETLTARENRRDSLDMDTKTLDQPRENPESPLYVQIALRHLKLHKYAAAAGFSQDGQNQESLEAAVQGTTSIVKDFLAGPTTAYVAPFAIALVVPAMIWNLRLLKSSDLEEQERSRARLNEFDKFLLAIEENYPGALVVRRIFLTEQYTVASSIPTVFFNFPLGLEYSTFLPESLNAGNSME